MIKRRSNTFDICFGFSLIELLVVLAIISILCAIVMPIIALSRAKGREVVCVSNLRQIGQAVHAYAADYDDQLPLGCDPLDKTGISWDETKYWPIIQKMSLLPDVLFSYIKSRQIWFCPSDTGFESAGISEEIKFPTTPSAFECYGTSYYAQTTFVLHQLGLSTFYGYNMLEPHDERLSSDAIFIYDGSGRWHGGATSNQRRFVSLYLDGHVKAVYYTEFLSGINVTPVPPKS